MKGTRFLRRSVAVARGIGWGHNPLRRPSDRVEGLAVVAAVVIMIVTIPLATALGRAVYHHDLVVSARETAAAVPTRAVLLDDAPVLVGANSVIGTVSAPGWWRTPGGDRRVGTVQASEGAKAGSTVRIWTDASGSQVDPPLSPDQAWARGGLSALFTLFGLAAALTLGVAVLRWRLNGVRYAEWDAEWREIGPRWTQRA